MTVYTFVMADRLPHSKDLFWDLVDQLEPWSFFPDCRAQIVFKLCRRGLEMVRRMDVWALKRVLWFVYRCNVANEIRFELKGAR